MFLISTASIQECNTGNVTESTPATNKETILQVFERITSETRAVLDALNATVVDTERKLRTTGISGPDADAVLMKLTPGHPAIVNVITCYLKGNVGPNAGIPYFRE